MAAVPSSRNTAATCIESPVAICWTSVSTADTATEPSVVASGPFRAVDGVSLHVDEREVLAIVGESGSGKSVSMLAVMGLLPWTAKVTADKMSFGGRDLLKLGPAERRKIVGKDMSMIFQEPMASLNPCFTVGFQIEEVLRFHMGMDKAQRRARAIELLRKRFTESLRIEDLAAAAHMSESSLHHRFKAVTAMSPMQFQKQLRLHEARRLMLTEGLEAAAAAHRVGYESPSQFSREYRRLFGAPPRREIETVRGGGLQPGKCRPRRSGAPPSLVPGLCPGTHCPADSACRMGPAVAVTLRVTSPESSQGA